ncbi:unnamed protein product [Ceutorhynchus assimilis]|uniref:Transposase domain-containing protein n=1 Tax=Ceutorhynchus assimilis TaxID=467358 RepID=A0A9N9QG51_9CUCU|nr:unnamed protein product [Ceutorhynchus assimilis]
MEKRLSKPYSSYCRRHIRRVINNISEIVEDRSRDRSNNERSLGATASTTRLNCNAFTEAFANNSSQTPIQTNASIIENASILASTSSNSACSPSIPSLVTEYFPKVVPCQGETLSIDDTYQDTNILPQTNSKKFLKSLTSWAVKTHLSHNAFNELLTIIRFHTEYKDIPRDCRTLLKVDPTLKKSIVQFSSGNYYHFGLKEGILETLKRQNIINCPEVLKISINIDGIPLTKSSLSQFWPILGFLDSFKDSQPFPIGVFHGKSKPENIQCFFQAFVNEFKTVKQNGIHFNNSQFSVQISKILCDAPAKSFVLNVKGHNSYSSCTKCQVEGEYINHRMSFLNAEASLRTHTKVANMIDEDYNKGPTPLTELNIDLVNDIPLDYMHLVCLGVTKRLLSFWVSGHQGVRFFKEDLDLLNDNLESFRKHCVVEFARLPRSLKELDRWKATEFRNFLLYYGPAAVKNVLKEPLWSHFLSFHVAIRILVSPDLVIKQEFLNYAEELIKYFVSKFGDLYGREYLNHNVHNLIHLVNDYAVTSFKEGGISVIPKCWMLNDHIAYWPNSAKNLRTLIIRANAPNLEWPTYKITKIYGLYDMYEDAIAMEKLAAKESSESESEGRGPGKRKFKRKQQYSPPPSFSNTTSESEISSPGEFDHNKNTEFNTIMEEAMSHEMIMEPEVITINPLDIHIQDDNILELTNIIDDSDNRGAVTSGARSGVIEIIPDGGAETQPEYNRNEVKPPITNEQIWKKLEDIDKTLKFILVRLSSLEATTSSNVDNTNSKDLDFTGLPPLPLKTIGEILDLEELLKSGDLKKKWSIECSKFLANQKLILYEEH